jgi:hypothetical protein
VLFRSLGSVFQENLVPLELAIPVHIDDKQSTGYVEDGGDPFIGGGNGDSHRLAGEASPVPHRKETWRHGRKSLRTWEFGRDVAERWRCEVSLCAIPAHGRLSQNAIFTPKFLECGD